MSTTRVRILVTLGIVAALLVGVVIGVVVFDGDDGSDVVADDTTTSVSSTSTPSTSGPTSTTTTTVPGDPPAVFADGYLLGWWDGARWVSATVDEGDELADPPDIVGDPYRFLSLGENAVEVPLGTIDGGCYLGNNWWVEDDVARDRVGVPTWLDALPRPVTQIAPAPAHEQAVLDWLRGREVEEPVVAIERVTRVDLDGDGADEVFIEANRGADGNPTEEAGTYSVVLYRFVDDDEQVQTVEIAGDVVTEEELESEFAITFVHQLLAIADLSGDGVMEVVTQDFFYEGAGVTVLTVNGPELTRVLDTGCGA